MAGPEVAVLFAEEGINGAHQDPQYNVLYRNINMYRSFVDAAEAKRVMVGAGIFQIDGAHNANATAKAGWLVMPELMVQHGINCAFSVACGMPKELIGLSTVPPNAPPAPKLWYDLPYAVALRDFFSDYRMRAQQNTRYIESDIEEAVRTHTIDTLISMLTGADIQSTITPDEGRNVPWHYNNIRGAADRQADLGGTGRHQRARDAQPRRTARDDGARHQGARRRLPRGGRGDRRLLRRCREGILRRLGRVPASATVTGSPGRARGASLRAPSCRATRTTWPPSATTSATTPCRRAPSDACDPIGGCTLCDPSKIVYIDELDPEDSVERRLAQTLPYRNGELIRPEAEWAGDGVVLLQLMIPDDEDHARAAALEMARRMGLADPEVVNLGVLHPAEGCFVEVKGTVAFDIRRADLKIPPKEVLLSEDELRAAVKATGLTVVAGTVGEDEHSVGMREILDIKHGGIEKYGVKYHYLGTSVPLGKLVDAAIETGAHAILISTIISHNDVHRTMMRKLAELCQEKGIRERMILVAGGTQVSPDMAAETGLDATFGRGTKGIDVVNALVKALRARGVDTGTGIG